MKKSRDYIDYLQDISEAVEKALFFVKGMTAAQFHKDEKTLFAVIRAIEIIGEAAKHVPKTIREQNSVIPWSDLVGMRNVVSHDYCGIDVEVVWLTVQKDLLPLKETIDEMLINIKIKEKTSSKTKIRRDDR